MAENESNSQFTSADVLGTMNDDKKKETNKFKNESPSGAHAIGVEEDAVYDDGKDTITDLDKQSVTPLLMAATLTMSIQSFIFGISIGAPNNSQPAMIWDGVNPPDSPFAGQPSTFDPPIPAETWNWIVSLVAIGALVGGVGGGTLVDRFGPKMVSLATDIVFVASGLLMGLANGEGLLLAGRIVLGVACGLCCNSVPIYNNDVSPIRFRGAFGVFHQLFVTIGILIAVVLGMSSVVGNPDHWWVLYGIPVPLGVLHFVIMFLLPDSPKWLISKDRQTDAEKALQRVRGGHYNIDPEICMLIEEEAAANETGKLSNSQQYKALFSSLYIKQITVGIMLMVFQQLSGINAVMFYSNSIFVSAGFSDPEIATIIVSAFNVIATFPAIPIIERMGRRFLLLGGFGGQALFHIMFVLSMVFDWSWASVVFILLGVGFFAVGPGPIPWMITSEILPASVAPAGVSLCVGTNWLFTFVVGQVYPYMNDGMGAYSFLPFAVCCVLCVIFTWFFVPETKGKTIAEIELAFNPKRKNSSFVQESSMTMQQQSTHQV